MPESERSPQSIAISTATAKTRKNAVYFRETRYVFPQCGQTPVRPLLLFLRSGYRNLASQKGQTAVFIVRSPDGRLRCRGPLILLRFRRSRTAQPYKKRRNEEKGKKENKNSAERNRRE